MSTIDDSTWREIPPRRSPLLLYAMGPSARQWAQSLQEWARAQVVDPELFQVFAPQSRDSARAGLAAALGALVQAAQDRGAKVELEVRCLAAAWETAPFGLAEELARLRQLLGRLVSGHQSITLSLVIPDALASDEILGQSRICCQTLEPLYGELPFLNAVFVFQTPADSGAADSRRGAALLAGLRRTLFDAEVDELVQHRAYPLMALNTRVDDHPLVYSALAGHTLYYLPEELQRHLEARFGFDLVRLGLDAAVAVPDPIIAAFRAQAASLITDSLAEFEACLARAHGTGIGALLAEGLPLDETAATRFREALEERLRLAQDAVIADCDGALTRTAAALQTGLDHALNTSPLFLAGGRAWLRTLAGEPLPATGLQRLTPEFIRPSLFTAAQRQFLGFPDDPQPPPEGAPPPQPAFLHDFETAALARVRAYHQRPHYATRDADDLFSQLQGAFGSASGALLRELANHREEQQRIEQDIETLLSSLPWYGRLFYWITSYRRQERELQRRRLRLDKDVAILIDALGALVSRYLELIEHLWWPHWQRCRLAEHLEQRQADLATRLEAFTQALRRHTRERWEACEPVTVVDTLTHTTVLDRERLDRLYGQTLGHRDWADHVRQALAHQPAATPGGPVPASLDPDELLQRIEAFAAARFAPVQALNVLDIMELGVTVTAAALFDKAATKLRAMPEFAAGQLPAVEQAGGLQRPRLVRGHPAVLARLTADYGHAFGHDVRGLDSEDANRIDITLLTLGFPASLPHVLRPPETNEPVPDAATD